MLPPGVGTPKISTNSVKFCTLTGLRAGPLSARPIMTGPTASGSSGICDLSISLN